MYRALYRKYRPQSFTNGWVGQEAVATALQNQIIAGKVGHAYLFTGTRGTGKTSCAKIFAKAVNCENRQGANPCGECAPCKGLEDGSILDVIEIDAASNNGVDDIRDLRDETAYRPSRCAYKVYIIDEVHMLSTQAFNALLKIMEEPPSHVIFILATTEIHKVPATILSRCQRYDFTRIPAEKIAGRLTHVAEQEGIQLAPEAADLIARLADGALRDALSLLDTCAGTGGQVDEALVRRMAGVTDKGYLFEVSEAIAAGDTAALLGLVASLREKSIDVRRLAEELVHHYRNIMLAAARPDGSLLQSLPGEERSRYTEAVSTVSSAFAISAVRRLADAMDKMGRSPDPRIELELALFDLSEAAVGGGLPVAAAAPAKAAVAPAMPPKAAAPAAFAPAIQQIRAERAEQPVPATAPIEPETVAPPVDQAPPLDDTDTPPWEEPPEAQQQAEPASPPQQAPPPENAPVEAAPVVQQAAPVPQPVLPKEPEATAPSTEDAPDAMEPFAPWPQVIESMAGVDRMLYSYMKGSTAYLEGGRVLISGGDMFLSYMREYKDAGEKIKNVIADATGKRYAIGPYSGPDKEKKQVTAQDTLQAWQQKGVPVEYVKDIKE